MRGKPRICIGQVVKKGKRMGILYLKSGTVYHIEQFVKERQEIKPLRTCVTVYLIFFDFFQKKLPGYLSYRFALPKNCPS